MMNMNMPLVDGKVTFHATLFGLVKTALGIGCSGMHKLRHGPLYHSCMYIVTFTIIRVHT